MANNFAAAMWHMGVSERRESDVKALARAKELEARLRLSGRLVTVEHKGRRWEVSRPDFFESAAPKPEGWNP